MDTIMLTIRKFRKTTPEEQQELMNSRQRERFDMGYATDRIQHSNDIQTDLLDVAITEEQFEAIRKSVLEKF